MEVEVDHDQTQGTAPELPQVEEPAFTSINRIEDDEIDQPKVIMSIIYQKPKLGCCFFDTVSSRMCVLEKFEHGDFSFVHLLKFEANPFVIITSSKMDPQFMEALQKDVDDPIKTYEVRVLKATEFSYDFCKNKLLLLELPDTPKGLSAGDKQLVLSRDIDFESHQMVRAAGALLSYIRKNKIVNELEGADDPFIINAIANFSLQQTLQLDMATMQALAIFKEEAHPSAHGIGKQKEGLSLFGVMNKTKSLPGRQLLRRWFLRPPLDLEVVEGRLDAISFFCEPINEPLLHEFQQYLKQVKDIARIVSRLRMVRYTVADWVSLSETIANGNQIYQLCQGLPMNIKIFKLIAECGSGVLGEIVSVLNGTINFEESRKERRLIPRAGVDEKLDETRNIYAGLDDLLTEIGTEEMNRYYENSRLIPTLKITYYPQIGFQIAVPLVETIDIAQQIQIEGTDLEYQFHTSRFIYFKNQRTRELDEYIGDIHWVIVDIESCIIRDLEQVILENAQPLMELSNLLAELDCLISLAVASREFKFSRPKLTSENVLLITEGRHPLQELCVPTFIPNDTAMAPMREGSMKIITGPNSSGKSVYIKQVGIIVFLSHIGCFVPAVTALVGLCDRIFSRITSRETVSLQQSTFIVDLSQISTILQHSTARSLLLVDEFGKGTEATDGLCLLHSFIQHLLERQSQCPKTLIATHFYELFEQDLLQIQDPNLELLTMDILLRQTGENENDDVVFLFKLIKGWVSFSHASYCALQAGIPQEIVDRGEEVCGLMRRGESITKIGSSDDRSKKLKYHNLVSDFLKQEFTTVDQAMSYTASRNLSMMNVLGQRD